MWDLTDEQIRKIKGFTLEFYSRKNYLHDIRHGERTVKIAELIAKKEGGMDLEIVRLGALIHQFHDHEDEFICKLLIIDSDDIAVPEGPADLVFIDKPINQAFIISR